MNFRFISTKRSDSPTKSNNAQANREITEVRRGADRRSARPDLTEIQRDLNRTNGSEANRKFKRDSELGRTFREGE